MNKEFSYLTIYDVMHASISILLPIILDSRPLQMICYNVNKPFPLDTLKSNLQQMVDHCLVIGIVYTTYMSDMVL